MQSLISLSWIELNTEFLLDFNCELNKKSRDDWKLLSSDHRHDARRSSHTLLSMQSLAFVMPSTVKVSFSLVLEKTCESVTNGFSYDDEVQCEPTLSFFYISNNGGKDECLYLTLRRYG